MKSISTPTTSYAKYEVKDGNGNLVTVTGNFEQVIIRVASFAAYIPNTDAPAVALAILTAAGFVPRGNRADSDSFQESVDTAAGYLDDAVLIQAGTAAKAELTKRRDDLAAKLFDLPVYELHTGPFDYADSTEVVRNAIDMIIQLQDEASK